MSGAGAGRRRGRRRPRRRCRGSRCSARSGRGRPRTAAQSPALPFGASRTAGPSRAKASGSARSSKLRRSAVAGRCAGAGAAAGGEHGQEGQDPGTAAASLVHVSLPPSADLAAAGRQGKGRRLDARRPRRYDGGSGRSGGAVDRTGLENRRRRKPSVGSNPTSSATCVRQVADATKISARSSLWIPHQVRHFFRS